MSAQDTKNPQKSEPFQQLLQLSMGCLPAVALYAVAKLGAPEHLAAGPLPVNQLARLCGANEDALHRILRALASLGVFTELTPRTFALTAAGRLLLKGEKGSVRDMVLWMADPFHLRVYNELLHSAMTGETVEKKLFGMPIFDYFEKDKQEAEVFNNAMTSFSANSIPAVLEVYDFSWLDGGTLADIAGGHGFVLTAILQKHAQIRGILFDLESVVSGAKPRIESLGLSSRCQAASGDFFKAVPAANAYVMKNIIHDWDDKRAISILKNCHSASIGKSKVILIELVLTPGDEPHPSKWIDLEMLLLPGGRERTEQEYAALFARAGFRLTRVVPTKSPVSVIEAEKIG